MSAAKSTTDHEVIRKWAERRGGFPVSVRGTEKGDDEAGLLRIDLPGGAGEDTLQPISWDAFFEKFDEKKLAFLYQEDEQSTFFKLVNRDSAARH